MHPPSGVSGPLWHVRSHVSLMSFLGDTARKGTSISVESFAETAVLRSCGALVENEKASGAGDQQRLTLKYLDGISVGQEYWAEQCSAQQQALQDDRKLALVLDLDHTLLHSKMRSSLTPQVCGSSLVNRRAHAGSSTQLKVTKATCSRSDTF